MISFRQKGDFSKLTRFLERAKEAVKLGDLDKYGREGVDALASATPIDSGLTAQSWYYKIENKDGSGTRNGGWVEGRDYINPAIQPIFDKIAEEAWKGVTKL